MSSFRVTPTFIPPLGSFEDVRQVLANQLNQIQLKLGATGLPTDFQGSRVSNIGNPQQPGDAVNLQYLQGQLIPQIQGGRGFGASPPGTSTVLATRLSALGSGLGPGSLVWVIDYAHMLQWNGSGFGRGPGDLEHSDSFHSFGSPPTDVGWVACDGSTVNYLGYNGTLTSRVLPDLGTAAYPKATKASYTPAISSATLPTISGETESSTAGAASSGFSSGGTSALTTDPGHIHALNATDAPISLPGDPIPNFSTILYYRQ